MADTKVQNGNSSNRKPAVTMQQPPDSFLNLPTNELLVRLKTSSDGLTSQDAAERLEIYGRNELAREHKHSALKEFLLHFKSPLVIILMIAGLISAVVQEFVHVGIIF